MRASKYRSRSSRAAAISLGSFFAFSFAGLAFTGRCGVTGGGAAKLTP